jgi:hypothetical protein
MITISPGGLSLQSGVGDPITTSYWDFFVGGSNFLVGSQIFDRSSLRARATLTVSFAPQAMAISFSGDRAVFGAGSNRAQQPIDWACFRTDSFSLVGSARSGGYPTSLQKMVTWGTDGIAAIGGGYLFLGRYDFASPFSGDSDGDGIPDAWEIAHGLNPLLNDAGADPDMDGASNFAEYLADTDPQSAADSPRIIATTAANGQLRLFFPCGAGHSYFIDCCTNLASGVWNSATNAVSIGGMQLFEAGNVSAGQAFYRVHLAL